MSLERESFGAKAWRKTKENPMIPLGFGATVASFLMATVRMRQGRKRAMNNWLWLRVTAQAFTITVIAGSFFLTGLKQKEAKADREAIERQAQIAREEFEERLRHAEQVHAEETSLQAKLRTLWASKNEENNSRK
ncbi:hypothetical protein DL96DRAFT_1814430 [Flagelloscypha sp. PMI_526]|nr:hypothetical protein DL96DRAFT_1814430 [Flagelloscypha sp. PMI_526]